MFFLMMKKASRSLCSFSITSPPYVTGRVRSHLDLNLTSTKLPTLTKGRFMPCLRFHISLRSWYRTKSVGFCISILMIFSLTSNWRVKPRSSISCCPGSCRNMARSHSLSNITWRSVLSRVLLGKWKFNTISKSYQANVQKQFNSV